MISNSRIFLLSAIVALSSCAGLEVDDNQPRGEISVVAGLKQDSVPTRGLVTGTSLSEGETPRNLFLSSYNTETSSAYFVSATYKRSSERGYWLNYEEDTPSPIYWPVDSRLDFLSYSVGSTSPIAVWDPDNPSRRVDLEVTSDNLNDDILFACSYDIPSSHGMLDLTYSHAQAWIEFDVGSPSEGIVSLQSITLKNVKQSGHLALLNNYGNAVCLWDLTGVTGNEYVMVPESKDVSKTVHVNLSVLLPQQNRTSFEICYLINGTEYVQEFPLEYYHTWLSGKHYKYKINVDVHGIFLGEVSVVDMIEEPISELVFD